jgi:hypothetical protein
VQDQAGRVGLRVAADDHHLLAHLGQRGDQMFWVVVDLPMPPLP